MARGLTALKIENVKADPNRRKEVADHGKPGLYLVVQPSGKKSWAVRYRRLSDRQPRKFTLDGFPSLAVARQLAQRVLDKVAKGEDPSAQKQIDKRTVHATDSDLFSDVAVKFIKRDQRPDNRSWRETARILGLEEAPDGEELLTIPRGLVDRWGSRRIQEITKREIIDHIDGVRENGKPVMANRTLAAIRRLFQWCIEKDIRSVSPCAGVVGSKETERERVLSDDEIRWFWKACGELDFPFGSAAKLLLLTGQRRGEVSGMRLGEIKEGMWTIPASRTKNKKTHIVPFSRAVLDIIRSLPSIKSEAGFIFTANGRNPISGWNKAKQEINALMLKAAKETDPKAALEEWRIHDLRRTCATGMQRIKIPQQVVEKCLNHTSGSFRGVTGIYQRHDFMPERSEAYDAWADEVERIVTGKPADVIRLRRV